VRPTARGEIVLVTDWDQVVAEIVPPRKGRSPLASETRLVEAVRKSWITPPLMTRPHPDPLRSSQLLGELEGDPEEG